MIEIGNNHYRVINLVNLYNEQLTVQNEELLNSFSKKWLAGKYSFESIKSYMHYSKRLLLFLQKQKSSVDCLTADVLSDYLIKSASEFPKSKSNILFGSKAFVRYLTSESIINEKVQKVLDVKMIVHRPLYIGFSEEECRILLNAPNRNTPVGKRDYAMMLLAKSTGMRIMDIRSLRLRDIVWADSEIRFIQSKNQTALNLPLTNDVGDAISDYILNGRPKTTANEIFVSSREPFSKLINNGGGIISRYVKSTNLQLADNVRKGFHSFRRSLGVSMLQAEVPLTTISQILGHNEPNSVKPYLAINLKHLKDCAMPMNDYLPRK